MNEAHLWANVRAKVSGGKRSKTLSYHVPLHTHVSWWNLSSIVEFQRLINTTNLNLYVLRHGVVSAVCRVRSSHPRFFQFRSPQRRSSLAFTGIFQCQMALKSAAQSWTVFSQNSVNFTVWSRMLCQDRDSPLERISYSSTLSTCSRCGRSTIAVHSKFQ